MNKKDIFEDSLLYVYINILKINYNYKHFKERFFVILLQRVSSISFANNNNFLKIIFY